MALRIEVERRGGVLVVATPGSALHQWLRRARAHAAVVRPDGTAMCAGRDANTLCAALSLFGRRW